VRPEGHPEPHGKGAGRLVGWSDNGLRDGRLVGELVGEEDDGECVGL
jgi:hypothetical protein